jgi:hypothetical protein
MSPSHAPLRSGLCADLIPHDLDNFRAWVSSLRDHDEINLRKFGLDLSRLRAAATAGKTYGYADRLLTVDQARKLIENPQVKTIRVADVAYDLDR